MRPDTFRTLAEYINELQRRDWNNYGTTEYPTDNTEIKNNSHWIKGNRSRNDGRGENS